MVVSHQIQKMHWKLSKNIWKGRLQRRFIFPWLSSNGLCLLKPPQNINLDSDDVEITAYIYVEWSVAQPSAWTGSFRAVKPKNENNYAPWGLTMFKASVSYKTFLDGVANQLPCAVENIIQKKVTWKFQSPAQSTHLSLRGKVGFCSMVGQIREWKPGTRIVILAMPLPRKPLTEKLMCILTSDSLLTSTLYAHLLQFWNDDNTKSFDYLGLDIMSTHDVTWMDNYMFSSQIVVTWLSPYVAHQLY